MQDRRLSGLNNKHLFFTVLGAASPRSRCWQIQFLVRGLPWVADSLHKLLAKSSQDEGRI